MLEVCALLFKLVVIVLEHLDELLVVLDPLLVVEFDGLKRDAIVVRDICHASQLSVLCSHVIHEV